MLYLSIILCLYESSYICFCIYTYLQSITIDITSIHHVNNHNFKSAITYEARYGGIDTKGIFPSLNLTQWNKAFYDLCDGLCSMLVLELMSDNRLPSINKYQYKPNDSPAFNNILYREHALKALKESFPEPMAEKVIIPIIIIIIIIIIIKVLGMSNSSYGCNQQCYWSSKWICELIWHDCFNNHQFCGHLFKHGRR